MTLDYRKKYIHDFLGQSLVTHTIQFTFPIPMLPKATRELEDAGERPVPRVGVDEQISIGQ